MANIPSDPVMLYSWINTRLRDVNPSLESLCEEIGVPQKEIEEKLSAAGFEYIKEINQFR